ncbi:RES family NAD+ phosphorylase [Niabella hirudinis]|uniref:RES family NAD+ phosphorylase n=1 Tax=Niabella hirudinis TaxID=1285929 RepID=UPI003EBCF3A8
MNVYRIVKKKHLDENLKGIGAGITGGRWNKKDTRCIYTAESRALATVEQLANTTRNNYLTTNLVLRTLFVPDDCIFRVPLEKLPVNWRDKPASIPSKAFGTALLESRAWLAYILPSAIIPEECNIIIDPVHPDMKKVIVIDEQEMEIDERLKEWPIQ